MQSIIFTEATDFGPRSEDSTSIAPKLVLLWLWKPFWQDDAVLSYLDRPLRSSQSMRSVDRTLGLLDFGTSDRFAIRVSTPV